MPSLRIFSLRAYLLASLALASFLTAASAQTGVAIEYQLPKDGPLPRTYLVTIASTHPDNPNQIISTFVAAQPRTVTAENQGKFTDYWNGLDENFMPVPPGNYGLKGIYSPAEKSEIDDKYHAVVPKFAGAISGWWPRVTDPIEKLKPPFGGDPVNSPFGAIAVGPNGVAVFYYTYLENGLNNPMIDLKIPGVVPEQFLRSFRSGGAAGGNSVTTDGKTVWAYSVDVGGPIVYRADGKPFGQSPKALRRDSYAPQGYVVGMANALASDGTAFVYVAQGPEVGEKKRQTTGKFIDKITIHKGETGEIVGEIPLPSPRSIAIQGDRLYALSQEGGVGKILEIALKDGVPVPNAQWQTALALPETLKAAEIAVDSQGRLYVSSPDANKVYQFNKSGKMLRTFGNLDVQKPGTYDPMTLMAPSKLATWRTPEGQDRLIIVEGAGPNRVAEWDPETGALLRDFQTYQTFTNNTGYGVDPANPEHLYIQGHLGWLNRFKVDYENHTFKIDAVWPMPKVEDPRILVSRARDIGKTRVANHDGTVYLVGTQTGLVYRVDPDKCALSAAFLKEGENPNVRYSFWNDANDNGVVDDTEITPTQLPANVFSYHGQNWSDDLTFLAMGQGSRSGFALSPEGFDEHKNPIFRTWKKLFTDPVFEANANKTSTALTGANEQGTIYNSDWMQMDGTPEGGYYVQARSGKNFNANEGSEHKVAFYAPDGKGGYEMKWRVGRTALKGAAKDGEIYGGMRIHRPINGIIPVLDNSRCGVLLYTEDGLYLDSLFPDGKSGISKEKAGLYLLPGEYFTGSFVKNPKNGKIYFAFGKYTPTFFEAVGWSMTQSPVNRLKTLPKSITLLASQIATPPEIAISLRGGVGAAKFARFFPALGGVALDGSNLGWETAKPVTFDDGNKQTIAVQAMYDPEHLYLRWTVRKNSEFVPPEMPPIPRIFSHEVGGDTLDFYLQGDVNAKPSKDARPGDTRFIFGLFKKNGKVEPVGVGLYASWPGKGAKPQNYQTLVRKMSYAHVDAIAGAQYGYTIDDDGKGFVFVVAIPRSAIPAVTAPFDEKFQTLTNFSVNLGGHAKFWWANTDGTASTETYDEPSEAGMYPGSWAQVSLDGLTDGVAIKNWSVVGPFGGPEMKNMAWNLQEDKKKILRAFMAQATYPTDDGNVDLSAKYEGEMTEGYWKSSGKPIKWHTKSIADLDTRLQLGGAAELWYGSTWIYAPEAMELDVQFQTKPQNTIEWRFNNEKLKLGKKETIAVQKEAVTQKLAFKPGWNQLWFRDYCEGYGVAVGAVIKAPAEVLWQLKFSALPPNP